MDKRLKNISITFPSNWKDASDENPNGPPTFIDVNIDEPGILQISTAEYLSGKVPNPGLEDLIELSKNIGIKNDFGTLEKELSGKCGYGTFGSAQFSSNRFPHISIWHLSDGKNFVFATFICSTAPGKKQLDEVNDILMSIKRKSFLTSLFS